MKVKLQVDKEKHEELDDELVSLLKKWLSVAASQICSLEALSLQLPAVDSRMEESMKTITENFVSISSKIKEYDEEVKNISGWYNEEEYISILPEKLQQISDILASGNKKKALKSINSLKTFAISRNKKYAAALKIIERLSDEISGSLSKVIIAMQFQDWVSQNLVITLNVLGANIRYLKGEIDATIPALDHVHQRVEIDKEFTKLLILEFSLGELKNKFVDYLMTHEYITDPSEVGFEVADSTGTQDDDIELF